MTISQRSWSSDTSQSNDDGTTLGIDADQIRLLVIDSDEEASARLIADLEQLRHAAFAVQSPQMAVVWLETQSADVLVLFSESGEVVLDGAQRIRASTELPLIVVGPNSTAEHRVGAFDRGAEDYIVGPVFPAELDGRVRVLVRRERFRRRSDELRGPEGLVMHVRSHEVYVGAGQLSLTPKEFSILQLLLECRGEVVAPDRISLSIWGYKTLGSRNFVEAHISRLRGKLSHVGASDVVRTVRGVGYVIR